MGPRTEDLVPLDPLEISKDLKTQRLGGKIHYFTEIGSTNVYAFKIAKEGAEEGEIVVSEEQRRGKGRMGKHWISPPYVNLYLSAIFRPRLPASHAPQLTLMSAVALAETVQSFIPIPPQIKWPNDILVGGKKLAGILSESSCKGDDIDFVVVGIGINVNFSKELMPAVIQETATSILDLVHRPVNRATLARRLIRNLDRCYGDLQDKGFSHLAGQWERFFHLRGKRVRVELMGDSVLGRATGIDTEGALLLEDERGILQRIVAGDVTPLEP